MKKVFFDVGANHGTNSLHLAGDPEWEVYAFEPTPRLYLEIKNKTSESDNYHVFPLAVSDKPGVFEFRVAAHADWGTSSLLDFNENISETWKGRNDLKVTEKIFVTVVTLKDFLLTHDIKIIDYLHCDVQGVDLEVLMGLGDFIDRVKEGVMEVARDHNVKLYKDQKYILNDAVLFLYQNGFKINKIQQNDDKGRGVGPTSTLFSANELNVFYSR